MMTTVESTRPGLGRRAWDFVKGPLAWGVTIGLVAAVVMGFTDIDIGAGLSLISPYFADLSIFAAVSLAAVYVAIGAITGFAALVPDKINLGPHTDPEDVAEQRPLYVWQAIGSTALGLAIGSLILANPWTILAPEIALAMFIALSAIAIFTTLRSWREMDELHRSISNEATTIGYYLVVGVGGTWSVLAHLGFAEGPEFIDWIVILWSMILVASFAAMFRKGMLEE